MGGDKGKKRLSGLVTVIDGEETPPLPETFRQLAEGPASSILVRPEPDKQTMTTAKQEQG
jgi:hypothetical protein